MNGTSSTLATNAERRINKQRVATQCNNNSPYKSSAKKSSKKSAVNEDIILEDEENRLLQMKQISHKSPGGIVAVPDHPDKIFDYE